MQAHWRGFAQQTRIDWRRETGPHHSSARPGRAHSLVRSVLGSKPGCRLSPGALSHLTNLIVAAFTTGLRGAQSPGTSGSNRAGPHIKVVALPGHRDIRGSRSFPGIFLHGSPAQAAEHCRLTLSPDQLTRVRMSRQHWKRWNARRVHCCDVPRHGLPC